MKLGSRVKAWREAQSWSLERLGQKAGVEKQVIWALESRDSAKSMHGPAIAKAFGLSYEQLLDPSVTPVRLSEQTADTQSTHSDAPKKKRSAATLGTVSVSGARNPMDFDQIVKTLNQFAEIMSALEEDQREGITVYVKKLIEHADEKDSVAKNIHMIKAIIEASKQHQIDLAPPKSTNSKV